MPPVILRRHQSQSSQRLCASALNSSRNTRVVRHLPSSVTSSRFVPECGKTRNDYSQSPPAQVRRSLPSAGGKTAGLADSFRSRGGSAVDSRMGSRKRIIFGPIHMLAIGRL